MRTPQKFQLFIQNADGSTHKKEILGYEVPMPYPSIKVFSAPFGQEWGVYDIKTGIRLASDLSSPSLTEEDAINKLVSFINLIGVEGIQKGINDFLEKCKQRQAEIKAASTPAVPIDKVRSKKSAKKK